MAVSFYPNDLSTDPPTIQVSDGDRETWPVDFAAALDEGESVVSASAEAVLYGPMTVAGSGNSAGSPIAAGLVENVALADDTVEVTLSGFVRGNIYELSTVATTSLTRRLTAVTFFEVVA